MRLPLHAPGWPRALFVAILIGSFAAYAPTLRHGLIDLDDPGYVANNAMVAGGLAPAALRAAFTQPYASMYAPLLWLSYMADVSLLGASAANPWGFHFTNILLHSLNTGLFYVVLLAFCRKPWRAFFCAALWALHPQRVESIAWVAERKDVLAGFFALLCVGSYLRAWGRRGGPAARPAPGPYLAALCFLALGLLVKPMLVAIPGLLLLLDFWPLGRLGPSGRSAWRASPRLLLEKLPFLALALAGAWAVVRIHAQDAALEPLPLLLRLKSIPVHCGFYLAKMVCPRRLCPLYPGMSYPAGDVVLGGGMVLLLLMWAWQARKTRPNVGAGILWFMIALAPVAGLVRFGVQAVADRFTYLPAMGISIALLGVFPSPRRASLRRPFQWARAGVAAAVLAASAMQVLRLLPAWRDSESFYAHVRRVFPGHPFALQHESAKCLFDRQDYAAAEALTDEALQSGSRQPGLLVLKAMCVAARQGPLAAKEYMLQNFSDRNTLGIRELQLAIYSFAAEQYAAAIGYAEEGLCQAPANRPEQTKLRLVAMAAAFHNGEPARALAYAKSIPCHRNMARVESAELLPFYLDLWQSGHRALAAGHFRLLLQANPDRADLLAHIAWGFATATGSPVPPAETLELAWQLNPPDSAPNAIALDTLAAAQANAGEFPAAAESMEQALALLAAKPDEPAASRLRDRFLARLALYRQGLPYREDAFALLYARLMAPP